MALKDNILLMNGDCLKLLPAIKDNSIDMILCDLPYGTTQNKWDVVIPLGQLWEQYKRIIKPNGAILLFCDGLFMAELMKSNIKMWRYNLIWDKTRGCDFLNANVKPLKSHEEIAVFYEKKPTYNKQYWYSTPYKCKTGSKSSNYDNFDLVETKSDGERNPLTILSFARDKEKYHPTQKPVALLEYLIKTYTNEGEVVLDNCMGSGSTAIACLNTNRRCVGIELNKEYYDIAQKRVNEWQIGY